MRIGPAYSITEEENQVDSCLLDALLADTVCRTSCFGGTVQVQAQKSRKLILQHEFGEVAIPELLAKLHECPLADLLSDGQSGAKLSFLVCCGDLEKIEIQRPADRFSKRRGEEARGNAAGRGGEGSALT